MHRSGLFSNVFGTSISPRRPMLSDSNCRGAEFGYGSRAIWCASGKRGGCSDGWSRRIFGVDGCGVIRDDENILRRVLLGARILDVQSTLLFASGIDRLVLGAKESAGSCPRRNGKIHEGNGLPAS